MAGTSVVSLSETSNIVPDNCGHSENACWWAEKSIPKIYTYAFTYYFSVYFHIINLMMCEQNAVERPEAHCSS